MNGSRPWKDSPNREAARRHKGVATHQTDGCKWEGTSGFVFVFVFCFLFLAMVVCYLVTRD